MFVTNKTLDAALAKTLDDARIHANDCLRVALGNTSETATKIEAAITASLESRIQELFQKALEADRQKRYDSTEPFVEIVSQTFSEDGGVQMRLDWNKPFIEYLKKNGFTGPSDEAIVDNWFVALSRERIAEGGSEYK